MKDFNKHDDQLVVTKQISEDTFEVKLVNKANTVSIGADFICHDYLSITGSASMPLSDDFVGINGTTKRGIQIGNCNWGSGLPYDTRIQVNIQKFGLLMKHWKDHKYVQEEHWTKYGYNAVRVYCCQLEEGADSVYVVFEGKHKPEIISERIFKLLIAQGAEEVVDVKEEDQ